jgi:hypothetical protein
MRDGHKISSAKQLAFGGAHGRAGVVTRALTAPSGPSAAGKDARSAGLVA